MINKIFILHIFISFLFCNVSYCIEKKSVSPDADLSDSDLEDIGRVGADHFKVVADEAYMTNVFIKANYMFFPDDSIKIIKNAYKNRNKAVEEKPLNIEPLYNLDSVISSKESTNWFAVINKKVYSSSKKAGESGVFDIVEAGERYIMINFYAIREKDLELVKKNRSDKVKYSNNIKIIKDGKCLSIKIFLGQTYDIVAQRIYDGI